MTSQPSDPEDLEITIGDPDRMPLERLGIRAEITGNYLRIPMSHIVAALEHRTETPNNKDIYVYMGSSALNESYDGSSAVTFASGLAAFDRSEAALRINGQPVQLVPKCVQLLTIMTQRLNKLVMFETFDDIMYSGIYTSTRYKSKSNPIRVHMSRLRSSLEQAMPGLGDPKHGVIQTVPYVGYRLLQEWDSNDK